MFHLPNLPYALDALEPHIDAKTMEIHHTKHHQTYIDKLNAAIKDHDDLKNMPIDDLLRQVESVPPEIYNAVRNNGGGHANHELFWEIMTPAGTNNLNGQLEKAISSTFSSVDTFKEKFTQEALDRFGSGWSWLVVADDGKLELYSTPNQDSPYMQGDIPILGLDVWEHAYYLKYQNKRPEYIEHWWNLVNWSQVTKNYADALEQI
jgi:superoxide dismutase, Fe-Mn family